MRTLARLAVVSTVLTFLHLVFGGIVRITGSGMGCGDHWPKCLGSWIPPFDNPTIMIEWTHRLLALLVVLSIAALAFMARARRNDPGVSGRRGVLRPAVAAFVLVVVVALLGMVTVRMGNTTFATLAHWTLAMALLAVLIAAAIRAGAFGGDAARSGGGAGTPRAVRSLGAGAAIAFVTVVLGGLVAKYPGGAVACPSFPHCGATPANVPAGAAHIQMTHRGLAFLLFFHVAAVSLAISRRQGESRVAARAARFAAALMLLQVIIGATLVLGGLPASVRSAHQAVGIAVWGVMFAAAYLARQSSKAEIE
jgi:cytochrome c oxidase assembly protein subunit 15